MYILLNLLFMVGNGLCNSFTFHVRNSSFLSKNREVVSSTTFAVPVLQVSNLLEYLKTIHIDVFSI